MADPDPYSALGTVEQSAPGGGSAPSANDPYAAMGTVEQPAAEQLRWLKTRDPLTGKEATFSVPHDANDEAIKAASLNALGVTGRNVDLRDGAQPQNHSALDGLALGAWNAIDNAASLVNRIPGVAAIDQWSHDHLGTPTVDQTNSRIDAERADNSRTGFQTAGNVLATLAAPATRLGGAYGMLANGAIQGALSSDKHDMGSQGMSALEGAGAGLVGGKLIDSVAGVVAPRLTAAQQMLRNAGVQFTPGQLVGGAAKHIEDAITHLPFVGDAITAARARGYQQFNRGAVNDALSHIGQAVPDRIETGHGAVAYAKRAFGDAYDGILSRTQLVPDKKFGQDLQAVATRATDGTLNSESAAQLAKTYQSVILHRLRGAAATVDPEAGTAVMAHDPSVYQPFWTGKPLNGPTVKSMLSELRIRAGQASDPAYKQALQDMAAVVRAGAARSSSPEVAAELARADAGYAKYATIRRAAATPESGIFSPAQLQAATRANDTSIGKGASATGSAVLQPYAEAGRAVLPSKVGDSGTGPRVLVNSIAGSAATGGAFMSPTTAALTALGAGGASAAYSPASIRLLNAILARKAGSGAQGAATALRALAPLAGAVAAPTTVQATQR